jgi:hypothetical protein
MWKERVLAQGRGGVKKRLRKADKAPLEPAKGSGQAKQERRAPNVLQARKWPGASVQRAWAAMGAQLTSGKSLGRLLADWYS